MWINDIYGGLINLDRIDEVNISLSVDLTDEGDVEGETWLVTASRHRLMEYPALAGTMPNIEFCKTLAQFGTSHEAERFLTYVAYLMDAKKSDIPDYWQSQEKLDEVN